MSKRITTDEMAQQGVVADLITPANAARVPRQRRVSRFRPSLFNILSFGN